MIATQYPITQIAERMTDILLVVEDGNAVALTRNGETVAIVLSAWEYKQAQPPRPDFWQAFQAFRQQWNLAELGLDDDLFNRYSKG